MSEPISEALAARSVGRIFARRRFAGACLAVAALAAAGLLAMADRSVAQTDDDCAADTSTACSVTLISDPDTGLTTGLTTGYIERALDKDWFRVVLEGGTEYQIELRGANTGDGWLQDPELYGIIEDASGDSVSVGDSDSGVLFNSELIFTPTASGTYYIVAGSLDEFTDARGVVELFYLGRAREGAADGERQPVNGTYTAKGTYTLAVQTPPAPAYPDPGFQCSRWLIELWPGVGICISRKGDTARRYETNFVTVASVFDASASEGDVLEFEVTIDMVAESDVVIEYETSIESDDNAEPADFTAVSNGTVTIRAGQPSETFRIDTTEDLSFELNETFTVKLVNATNAILAEDPTARGTIRNDDQSPQLSIAPATSSEGSDLAFAVIVSPVSGIDAALNYSAAAGTATPGLDYEPPSPANGYLEIPAGQATGTILIPTIVDTLDEPAETLTVTLSDPVNARLGSPSTATGTIFDVIPPGVTLDPTHLRVVEDSTATYTVVLDAQPTGNVTITQSENKDDLSVMPSSKMFTPSNWATPQTFTVTAEDDEDFASESATIEHAVSGGGYDSVAAPDLPVTIVDDDLTLTIVPVPGFETVTEGEPALFHIIASNPTLGTVVSRAYSYRGDFPREWKSRSRGLVTIVDVDDPWLMTVDTVDDDAYERDGSVTMRLVVDEDSAYTVGNPSSATVQVLDNDTGQVPGTVAAPQLEWVSERTLAVLWSEPSDLGNPPTGTRYDVRYRGTGATAWTNGPQNLTRAQATIDYPGAAQSWQVQVRASNLAGHGPWSASATIRSDDEPDPGGADEPPQNLQGEAVAHQRLPIWSIEVDWDYPKDLSWWQLKGWMLQWQHECVPDPDPENWSSTAKAATPLEGGVQWLGPGKSVQIRVAPIYIHGGGGGVSEGIGPFSEPVCVTTPDEWTPPDLGERPPLTASFEEVPQRHGGSVRFFTLEITFSERMDVTGRQLVKALQITGGHARDVPPIRVEPPWTLDTAKPDAWKVYVTPSSDQPVTVTIPAGGNCGDGALCTEDGRALSESISVTIPGP